MKNLIKSRRGIAIEMAIGAMFIMIALSIVLISISGMQNAYKKQDIEEFNEKVESYEILDYLIKNKTLNNTFNDDGTMDVLINQTTYKISKADNAEANNTATYTVTDNGEVVLTFITDADGKITSWGN